MTFENQEEIKEKIDSSTPKENFFMFEVFDNDGILLCNIKPEESIIPYKFIIQNNRFFIINSLDMCIYEYRIVDSE